jgi:hypothetical protein
MLHSLSPEILYRLGAEGLYNDSPQMWFFFNRLDFGSTLDEAILPFAAQRMAPGEGKKPR